MTTRDALTESVKKLRKAGLGRSAALDAEILLMQALGSTREELLMKSADTLPAVALRRFRKSVTRRLDREPVAYIIGRKEFFGLEFKVRKGACLIPRPDTEVMVERAIAAVSQWGAAGSQRAIVDVGTGSGAIAVAVAKNVPGAKIVATDISPAALRLARENAEANGVAKMIRFVKTDLLPKDLPRHGSLLVLANLPYVPLAEWKTLEPEVRLYEPRLALVGGKDGLAAYKRLLLALERRRPEGGFTLLAEIHPEQYAAMAELARKRWPQSKTGRHKDLAGKARVIEITT